MFLQLLHDIAWLFSQPQLCNERSFFGNFLRLNIFIFFVNYLCLQSKLFALTAISVEPPFPSVGFFLLKFCQFPAPLLYFFTCPNPCHASHLLPLTATPSSQLQSCTTFAHFWYNSYPWKTVLLEKNLSITHPFIYHFT